MSKFELGRVVATPGALALDGGFVVGCLERHVQGDWGEVDAEDQATNDRALTDGDRLLSAYTDGEGRTLWVITEWDRSATTCLLPSEY
jgi:hypothetical protein